MANKKTVKASNTEASKAETSQNYTVTVTPEFTSTATGADSRTRAGVVVPTVGGYTGPLTDAQRTELEADRYLTVKKG
jgi:hypothetical protein